MLFRSERFAEEDKKRKDEVETRNNADSLVYNTEKTLKELGDKVDSADKAKIEDELAQTKKALESNDLDDIKAATEKLTQVSYEIFGKIYQQQAPEGGGAPGGDPQGGEAGPGDDDNVVDADYEVMDDDK